VTVALKASCLPGVPNLCLQCAADNVYELEPLRKSPTPECPTVKLLSSEHRYVLETRKRLDDIELKAALFHHPIIDYNLNSLPNDSSSHLINLVWISGLRNVETYYCVASGSSLLPARTLDAR